MASYLESSSLKSNSPRQAEAEGENPLVDDVAQEDPDAVKYEET